MSIGLPVVQPVDQEQELLRSTVPFSERVLAVHAVPVFSDDSWDLTPEMHRPNEGVIRIDFAAIREECGPWWAQVIKEYVWHRLNRKVASVKPAKVDTAKAEAGVLRRLARLLLALGVLRPSHLSRSIEYRLLVALKDDRDPETIQRDLRLLQRVWRFRSVLSDAPRRCPWNEVRPSELVKYKPTAENKTPRVPAEVMRPLLDGCLHIIENKAPAILQWLEAWRSNAAPTGPPPLQTRTTRGRIELWLGRRAAEGLGLPAHPDGRFHLSRARREAAVSSTSLKRFRGLLREHSNKFGRDTSGRELPRPSFAITYDGPSVDRLREWLACRDTPLPAAPKPCLSLRCPYPADHPVRWVDVRMVARAASISAVSFFQDRPTTSQLWAVLAEEAERRTAENPEAAPQADTLAAASLPRLLVAACFLVQSYLTGMRESEVGATNRGAVHVRRSEDGLIDRYWIKSRQFKGKGAHGNKRRWVAIPPVVQATEVMEKRAEILHLSPEQGLYSGLAGSVVAGGFRASHLKQLIPAINAYARIDGIHAVPDIDGQQWSLTTRQFRRTLAWHIARQPFGTIAGSIQYGQLKAATFERYAGSTYSELHQEIAEEEIFAGGEILLDLFFDNREGRPPRGPKAKQLKGLFAWVEAELATASSGAVITRAELHRILKSQALHVRVGIYNICIWDPSKAACHEKAVAVEERKAPIMSFCDPGGCENSCIPDWQVAAIQRAIEEVEDLLLTPGISSLQRRFLEADREQMVRSISDAA